MRIDLNSDVGESFGRYCLPDDQAIMAHITSANVACGCHAGDPCVMEATVESAIRYGLSIGAHPGYPDLQGFGRREMSLAAEEIEAYMLYQVAALAGVARAAGAEVVHVKPHGALYNTAARDPAVARAVARGVARFSRGLVLVGLGGSFLVEMGLEAGLRVASEAFADRSYNADGSLCSRVHPGAVLTAPEQAAAQSVRLATQGIVLTRDGQEVQLKADTLCIHGDTPTAPAIAQAVRAALRGAGVDVVPMGSFI